MKDEAVEIPIIESYTGYIEVKKIRIKWPFKLTFFIPIPWRYHNDYPKEKRPKFDYLGTLFAALSHSLLIIKFQLKDRKYRKNLFHGF